MKEKEMGIESKAVENRSEGKMRGKGSNGVSNLRHCCSGLRFP